MTTARHCTDCKRQRQIHARLLCWGCYMRHKTKGSLDQFPVQIYPSEDLLEDFDLIRNREMSMCQQFKTCAPRLGVKWRTLEQAYRRAKRKSAQTV